MDQVRGLLRARHRAWHTRDRRVRQFVARGCAGVWRRNEFFFSLRSVPICLFRQVAFAAQIACLRAEIAAAELPLDQPICGPPPKI